MHSTLIYCCKLFRWACLIHLLVSTMPTCSSYLANNQLLQKRAFDRITEGGSFGMMGKRSFDRLSTSNGNFGMVGGAKRGAFDRLASGASTFGMAGKRSFDRLDVGSFRMYGGGGGKRANSNNDQYDDDEEQVLWKRAFDRINAGGGFGLKKRASFNIDESPPQLFANDQPFIVYYQPDMKPSIDSSGSGSSSSSSK